MKILPLLFTASLSIFSPSCSVQNNPINDSEEVNATSLPNNIGYHPHVRYQRQNIDSSYFNKIIKNPESNPNIRVIFVDTFHFDFHKFSTKKKSSALENYILSLNEEGSFSIHKESTENSNNRLASIICYNSQKMESPFFVNLNVGNFNTNGLALYAHYNESEDSYSVYLVIVGDITHYQKCNKYAIFYKH